MKFTKVGTSGQCRAMRCSNPSIAVVREYELCSECLAEGCKELVPSKADPQKPSQLAEAKEVRDSILDFGAADVEEYCALVALLSDAMDAFDAAESARTILGAPHREAWEAINAKQNAGKAWKETIDSIKRRIADIRHEQEISVDLAIEAGEPVPDIFETPPGLSVKPEVSVKVEDVNLVPEEWLTKTIDTKRVLDALEADSKLEIPGLSRELDFKVVFRRAQ